MDFRKLVVFCNVLLIFIIFLVFQVAARELLEHSTTRVTGKMDREFKQTNNADNPWGHGYIHN
ncbi:unnamed protein product [Camellia sinensis]